MRRLALVLLASAALPAAVVGALWLALPDPASVAAAPPRSIAVIEQRRAEARRAGKAFRPRQSWVGLPGVSPQLVQAVLLSEDAGFWVHGAFDWHEVRAAAEDGLRPGGKLRGASTLTQQAARTLWLGTDRTVWRKLQEAVLAVKMERRLSKRRILALYLDSVEWGDGVFGAEAAARARFGVSAGQLDTAQAVLLASMLPSPRRADLRRPPRWLARRSHLLLDRMLRHGRIDADAHAHASALLERYLAGASGEDEPPPEGADGDG